MLQQVSGFDFLVPYNQETDTCKAEAHANGHEFWTETDEWI